MKKVRYAVVGAGWISQEAFMPAVAQTGNSEVAAIVSGNLEKAKALAEFHAVPAVYNYDQYDAMLASGTVDAVYIALPNSQHADYAIRAARAGVHALVEKPLALTAEECKAMIAAADASGVWLMTAYRLHTEPGTVAALELVRSGAIGDPRMFSSVLCFQSDARNHRLQAAHWGGPLQDLGVYCINAARHLFGSEPIEVVAMTGRADDDPRFAEVEETFAATLRFPGGRMANFFASFGATLTESYSVHGSKGTLEVSPGYRFETARRLLLTVDGKSTEQIFPHVDNFSGQTAYFSDCILNHLRPEADGEEGLADVVIMRALEEAARSGRPQPVSLPPRSRRPGADTVRPFPHAQRRLLVP